MIMRGVNEYETYDFFLISKLTLRQFYFALLTMPFFFKLTFEIITLA